MPHLIHYLVSMLSQNNSSSVIESGGDSEALKKLIIQAKNGDSDAFGQVYTLLYVPLYRYTVSKCHDKELSNDICQQAFLQFYGALSSYEPEKTPLAYLFTIAKRLLINQSEKKTFESFDETLLEKFSDDIDSSASPILDEAHVRDLSEKIISYLHHLTTDEQEVIRLYFFSELSYKEISDITEKEEAYLRKIKERALKKLRILTSHLYETN